MKKDQLLLRNWNSIYLDMGLTVYFVTRPLGVWVDLYYFSLTNADFSEQQIFTVKYLWESGLYKC